MGTYMRAAAAANAVENHGDPFSGTNGVRTAVYVGTAKIASKG
jgi:hypothetical protein